jgi:hypothetical protein
MFVNGEWVSSESKATYDVINPATTEVIAKVPKGDAKDAARAVSLLAEIDVLRMFVNPVLERSLKAEQITIDALDFADDSLSLETDCGKRLIMSVDRGPT